MKFSIITPCFNAEKYIAETIESVICQRGEFEIQYIIVDGASNDGTLAVIEKYQKLIADDNFLRKCKEVSLEVISEKDFGMYDALVKGFRRVNGDIVAYINADDFYLPNAFHAVSLIFSSRSKVKWLIGCPTWFNRHGNIIQTITPYVYRRRLIHKGVYGTRLPFIQQESIFWRKELLETIDCDRLRSFKYAGDYYLWNQFAFCTQLVNLKAQLAGFRLSENQLSHNIEAYRQEMMQIVTQKLSLYDKVQIFWDRRMWDRVGSTKYGRADFLLTNEILDMNCTRK